MKRFNNFKTVLTKINCQSIDKYGKCFFSSSVIRPNSIHKPESELKKRYDAIVIGGGHNGLIAAFYLSRGGKKVCVLERRPTLGGAAVTEEIIPQFKFSRASYVLGLLRPRILKDMELQRHGLKVFSRNPSSYTPIHEKEWTKFPAKSLLLGPDLDLNRAEISKFSSKDAKAFEEYEALLVKFTDALSPLLEFPPPDLKKFQKLGLLEKLRYLMSLSPLYKAGKDIGVDATKLLQLLIAPSAKILGSWFESEPLIATLATDSCIGAMITPYTPGSGYVLLHHVMAQTNDSKGAWGTPEGGMGGVTQAMAKAAAEVEVDMFVDQTVEEILVDSEGRSCGVRLQSGKEVAAKAILSNATPKVTFLDLIPGGKLPRSFIEEVRDIDYTSPTCKINVALKSIPNFVADPGSNGVRPHHRCTIHLNCEDTRYIDQAYQQATKGMVPDKPLIEMTVPTAYDSSLAPMGCHVALLFTQYVPQLSEGAGAGAETKEKMKQSYVARVLDTVEEYAPGFKSSIVGYEALMPWDLEEIFGLTGGNIFHGSMSLDQLFMTRPTSYQAGASTPVPGLFLCGSGAHPGGGVMGASGLLAAQAVLQR